MEHFCIPDEFDNCVECGQHVELPDVGEPPDLGDIPGICAVIDTLAAKYARAIQENTDPKNPSQPRLRIVGNRIVRLSHKTILQSIVQPPYKEAKAMGYRGTLERFIEHVEERTPEIARTLFR